MDRSINIGTIHESTFCSFWSISSPWIDPKRWSTRGSDVTMTSVYIFQDGRRTKLLRKYVPVTASGCTWIQTDNSDYTFSRFLRFSLNTEWAIKADPSDYAVYTVSAGVYLYRQCSIFIVVSFYTRYQTQTTALKFYTKILRIIEAPKKRF